MPRIHELKCLQEYFGAKVLGVKNFELRRNDRGFKVGDYLAINEYDGEKYTGRAILERVDYLLNPNEVMNCQGGFVLMGTSAVAIMDKFCESARCLLENPEEGE